MFAKLWLCCTGHPHGIALLPVFIPGVSKQDVLEWCLNNAFELVELEKPEDEEEEEEDGFGRHPC